MQSIKNKVKTKKKLLQANAQLNPSTQPIAVVGAGAWGSALAVVLARNGSNVNLYGDNRDDLTLIAKQHQNPKFLGDIQLPPSITACFSPQEVLQGCRDILIVVPSHVFRDVLRDLKPHVASDVRIAIATKGLDPATQELMSELIQTEYGSIPVAVLSGPSFALEVAKGAPTAVALASTDQTFLADLTARCKGPGFYLQPCSDVIGVQLGGALKNAIAIVCGMSDGLGYGANTQAALISAGLQQITKLGIAMGAELETFMGLAGLGDLVLTCTDNQSRNRRFGLALGHGKTSEQALAEVGQTVEGLQNVKQIMALAKKYQIKIPVVAGLQKVLNGEMTATDAVNEILTLI